MKEKAMTKTIDAHEARVHFGQLLSEVSEKDYTFIVKRRGKITAVIISPEDYSDMLEIGVEPADGEVGTEEDIFKMLRGK